MARGMYELFLAFLGGNGILQHEALVPDFESPDADRWVCGRQQQFPVEIDGHVANQEHVPLPIPARAGVEHEMPPHDFEVSDVNGIVHMAQGVQIAPSNL